MPHELWDDLQYMVLGRDDPVLLISHSAYAGVLAKNRLSLIGKPLNLNDQPLKRVIQELPRLWGLNTRVHGRILDDSFVQFRFQQEEDMVSVLTQQPWLVNDWFVALQRWVDFPGEEFLTFIDLWVQLRGIPLPYVSERTVRYIANTIGDVVALDFNEDTTPQIAFLRVKVRIIFTDRLRFFRRVRFQSRERAMVGFEYEGLTKICRNCSRINHQSRSCPFLAPPVGPEEDDDELLVPVWEEGHRSHTPSHRTDNQSSETSDISSSSPISQPPRHPSPFHNDIQAAAEQPILNMFATNLRGK
ncbi:PREDICTED: uncharacterized protein At4g02000-like [Camelina sativa]|uniref:Uncharacterized protein At4g02000-like n=1 Tax=Camelina sativa TaxID=90675 RepID=A0ABM0WPB3_CAMSA|nr:PREDICTED: uncharacterized protein At4g02000-like [Camelina sativa]